MANTAAAPRGNELKTASRIHESVPSLFNSARNNGGGIHNDGQATIIGTHISGNTAQYGNGGAIANFEYLLEHLRDGGYTVVSLSDAIAAVTDGKQLPPRAVVITIDDAYRSVYEVAFPRFVEYGMTFTVFVS